MQPPIHSVNPQRTCASRQTRAVALHCCRLGESDDADGSRFSLGTSRSNTHAHPLPPLLSTISVRPSWMSRITTGDAVFTALATAKACAEVLPLLHALPAVETAFDLPAGRLRAGTAGECPCTGIRCTLHELAPALIGEAHRTLLCSAHLWVHRCGPHCTSSARACELWAAFLVARWAHHATTAWELHTSGSDDPTHPNTP